MTLPLGLRLPAIVLAAVSVNALMFGVIQFMVVDRQMRLSEPTDMRIANFVRVKEQSREVRSRRDPKAPDKPDVQAQQELARLTEASGGGGAVGALAVKLPDIDVGVDALGGDVQIARELTPLVRTPADYPPRALQQRIEGWVLVRFTVTESGSVADPEVVRSEPPGVFEQAALRAVLRWKYQPQLADGKPVSVVTYTRLVFAMAGDQKQ